MKGDYLTAIHESGHAVIAMKLGLPLWYVNVTDTDDSGGQAVLTSMDKAGIGKLGIYHLAGAVAHKKAIGSSEWPAEAARDLKIAELCCRIGARDAETFQENWDDSMTLATAMVEAHWDAIKRVASQLAWKGELVGSAVKKLMEAR